MIHRTLDLRAGYADQLRCLIQLLRSQEPLPIKADRRLFGHLLDDLLRDEAVQIFIVRQRLRLFAVLCSRLRVVVVSRSLLQDD